MTDTPTARLAAFIADRSTHWPADALALARHALVDIAACLVAGAAEPASERAFAAARRWGGTGSTVVGRQHALAPPWAALVNGTAAHALDLDDNFQPAFAHATAVMMPALLALGEAEDRTAAQVFDAFIVGCQVMARIGQALNPAHRFRGWHATSTVGAIGAAAGCARLLRLPGGAAGSAVSIATSMAGGATVQFGTMTKPLHAGLAAKAGVMAATLAEAGLTAAAEPFLGSDGYWGLAAGPDLAAERARYAAFVDEGFPMSFDALAVATPLALLEFGLDMKRFANCGSAHAAIEAALELRSAPGFALERIARVEITIPDASYRNLKYPFPTTPDEARFSLHYPVATALLTGDLTLNDFTLSALARRDVHALAERIVVHAIADADLTADAATEVRIGLHDGSEFAATVGETQGSKTRPFGAADLERKLAMCLDYAARTDRPRVMAAVLGFDGEARVRGLMAALRA